jgi:hypothetical protein
MNVFKERLISAPGCSLSAGVSHLQLQLTLNSFAKNNNLLEKSIQKRKSPLTEPSSK